MAQTTFTQRSLLSLKTFQKSEFFWDRDFRDGAFGVRVYATGKKVFVFDYRNEDGRQCRVTIGDVDRISLADARAKARAIYADAKRGKDESAERRKQRECPTLAALLDEYKPLWFSKLAPKTAYDTANRIDRYILPVFGDRKINEISRDDVFGFLRKIGCNQGAPVQADRVKETLRKIFNHACERGLIHANPAAKVESFQTKEQKGGREHTLSDAQLIAYWAATEVEEQPIRSYFRLLYLVVQRSGELARARWSDISFEEELWEFPKTKSGNMQVIPLTPLIIEELKKLRAANEAARARSRLADSSHYSEYLFPSPRLDKKGPPHMRNFAKACDRIEQRMGCKFTPHDLRRTAATVMRRLKIPSHVVAKVLNHRPRTSQMKCLERYDRYDEVPEMKEALLKLSEWIQKLITQKSGSDES